MGWDDDEKGIGLGLLLVRLESGGGVAFDSLLDVFCVWERVLFGFDGLILDGGGELGAAVPQVGVVLTDEARIVEVDSVAELKAGWGFWGGVLW